MVGWGDRDRVIEAHLPQVRSIAQKIHSRLPRHIELDDLVQTGILGLMEALENYDSGRRVELATYARYRIQGAILDSLRDQDWSPRLLRQKARRAELARQRLAAQLAREPSPAELAEALGMSLEAWYRMRNDLRILEVISLDSLFQPQRRSEADRLPPAPDEGPFELCVRAELKDLVQRALAKLTDRKRQVLELYYFKGLNMKQVAARLGVCESRVSQMHAAALASLRVFVKELLGARLALREDEEALAYKPAGFEEPRIGWTCGSLGASPT